MPDPITPDEASQAYAELEPHPTERRMADMERRQAEIEAEQGEGGGE